MRSRAIVSHTLVPLGLILLCPLTVVLLWHTMVAHQGSLASLFAQGERLHNIWPRPTLTAVMMVGGFVLWQALLMVVLPGRRVAGPVTPTGQQPTYTANGLLAWIVTNVAISLAAYCRWLSPTLVYDHFGAILTVCSLGSLLACALLYVKGLWFPSSPDAGRRGNVIYDYFWGVELHPRLWGLDLKQFANGRLGMMSWSVIILSFVAKHYETYHYVSNAMLVAVGLQLVYIGKFFYWESGYLATLDIIHDRFGFYLCWGVTTWLPCVYTSQILYLVHHPQHLPPWQAWGLLGVGLLAIASNYQADAQRQRVRNTNGQCRVWGKLPAVIAAPYRTIDGQTRHNLLLVSGWWGIARHCHYVPEIIAALAWTLPCGLRHVLPYFYVCYLTILLVQRTYRDEARCAAKYGLAWDTYCQRVPYRMLPGLF